jgi:hypothetical protein
VYAVGLGDGSDTVDDDNSKNITDANVTQPVLGTYCFEGLGFTPRNVMVTPEGGRIYFRADLGGCGLGQPGGHAAVQLSSTTQNPTREPFFVAFN